MFYLEFFLMQRINEKKIWTMRKEGSVAGEKCVTKPIEKQVRTPQ